MWSHYSLKPSTELEANTSIYSSFLPKKGISQSELIRHLSAIYDRYIQQKLSPQQIIKQLSLLPKVFLVQLFVEIEKFIKEKGVDEFEKRQKGSILSFFHMLTHALNDIDDPIVTEKSSIVTEKLIFELHKLSMQFSEHVAMKNAYRDDDELLVIHHQDVATAGIEYLIELIEDGTLESMELANCDEYEAREANLTQIYSNEVILAVIDNFKILRSLSPEKICKLIAVSLQLETTPTESDILEIFKKNKVMEILFDTAIPNSLATLLSDMQKPTIQSKLLDVKKDLESDMAKREAENEKFEERMITIDNIVRLKANGNYSSSQLAKKFMTELNENSSDLVLQFIHPQAVKAAMNKVILEFNQKLKLATTKDEMINCVAFYTQLLLLIHPFRDHNNRVFANGLANRILIQHGLPLAVYYNPFLFYAQAPPEVFQATKLALANYTAMQASLTHTDELLDFENGVKMNTEQEKFLDLVTKPLLDFFTQLNSPKNTIEKKA